MKQAILILELKGFAAQASQLALRAEWVDITAERVRSAVQSYIEASIKSAFSVSKANATQRAFKIGGDTWYFSFENIVEAVSFGVALVGIIYKLAVDQGLFYIKPSMALGYGTPKLSGESFLDDSSIATYRAADGGEPFQLLVLPEAKSEFPANLTKYLNQNKYLKSNGEGEIVGTLFDWRSMSTDVEELFVPSVLNIASFLTDSDVVHFSSNRDVLKQIHSQQKVSSEIRIFGGGINLADEDYFMYAKAAISLVRSGSLTECLLQNYFSPVPSPSNYAWLRACQLLAQERPESFAYSAYMLPNGVVRPIAYHIYDETVVLFLRRYNEVQDEVSMAGSILIRNERLTYHLKEHFLQGSKDVIVRFKLSSDFDKFINGFSFDAKSITEGEKLLQKLLEE